MTRLGYGGLQHQIRNRRHPRNGRPGGTAVADNHRSRAPRARFSEDLPPIKGDPILLEQVWSNILDNAGKIRAAGHVDHIAATEAGGWLALTVADDGPGIPPEDRDRVFDMFYRARGGDGQPTGTGLGLAICKGILEAHGGRISAGPVEPGGRGTKILVELPLAAAAARNSRG